MALRPNLSVAETAVLGADFQIAQGYRAWNWCSDMVTPETPFLTVPVHKADALLPWTELPLCVGSLR